MLSAPVFTCIYTLQLFIEIYSHVTDMQKICSWIKHPHLRCWRCLLWRNIFFFAKVNLFIVLTWTCLRFASTHFWEVSHLFTGVAFFIQRWTGSGRVWLTTTPSAHVVAFISRNFLIWFSKGLFEVEPNFFFHSKGFITWWRTCKSHCLSSEQ